MENIGWIRSFPLILGIIVILFGVMVYVILRRIRSDRPFDSPYRTYFFVGLSFFAIGIAQAILIDNFGLLVLGIVFVALGLTNRRKWSEQQRWSDFTPVQRRMKYMALGLAALLFVGVLVTLALQAIAD